MQRVSCPSHARYCFPLTFGLSSILFCLLFRFCLLCSFVLLFSDRIGQHCTNEGQLFCAVHHNLQGVLSRSRPLVASGVVTTLPSSLDKAVDGLQHDEPDKNKANKSEDKRALREYVSKMDFQHAPKRLVVSRNLLADDGNADDLALKEMYAFLDMPLIFEENRAS